MSTGNLKTQGNKGANYPFQLAVLRLLGRINTQLANNQNIVKELVNSDGLIGTIPDGYMLQYILAQPVGGLAPIVLDYGLTPGGHELSSGETVTPPTPSTVTLAYSAPGNMGFNVYASAPAWGTGTITFYLILKKI